MKDIIAVIKNRIEDHFPVNLLLEAGDIEMIDIEIDSLAMAIKISADVHSAKNVLDKLAEMQFVLAVLLFKFNLSLSDKQRLLVRKFDRADDCRTRLALFTAIKQGTLF